LGLVDGRVGKKQKRCKKTNVWTTIERGKKLGKRRSWFENEGN